MGYLTETQEHEFAVLFGTFFALSLSSDYLDGVKPVIEPRSKYVYNKVKSAEASNDALLKVIKREFLKTMTDREKKVTLDAIEEQKQFIYNIFSLDSKDQDRVKGLIKKIIKERS